MNVKAQEALIGVVFIAVLSAVIYFTPSFNDLFARSATVASEKVGEVYGAFTDKAADLFASDADDAELVPHASSAQSQKSIDAAPSDGDLTGSRG